MAKHFLLLTCALTLAAQSQPHLHRYDGPAPSYVPGNLAGFMPLAPQWPDLSRWDSNPREGQKVALSLTVVNGRPATVELVEGVQVLTERVLDQFSQWRFRMPGDRTSAVIFEASCEAHNGKYGAWDTVVRLLLVEETAVLAPMFAATPVYPSEAMKLGLEGTVELSLAVAPDGSVTAAQVIRGPQLLQQAALQAARQYRFEPGASRQTRVKIGFRIPPR